MLYYKSEQKCIFDDFTFLKFTLMYFNILACTHNLFNHLLATGILFSFKFYACLHSQVGYYFSMLGSYYFCK